MGELSTGGIAGRLAHILGYILPCQGLLGLHAPHPKNPVVRRALISRTLGLVLRRWEAQRTRRTLAARFSIAGSAQVSVLQWGSSMPTGLDGMMGPSVAVQGP